MAIGTVVQGRLVRRNSALLTYPVKDCCIQEPHIILIARFRLATTIFPRTDEGGDQLLLGYARLRGGHKMAETFSIGAPVKERSKI